MGLTSFWIFFVFLLFSQKISIFVKDLNDFDNFNNVNNDLNVNHLNHLEIGPSKNVSVRKEGDYPETFYLNCYLTLSKYCIFIVYFLILLLY